MTIVALLICVFLIGVLILGALSGIVGNGAIGRLCCRLDWHKPIYTGLSGINVQARCERCNYEGLIDSQGNLF